MACRQWYVRRGRIGRRTFWLSYFLPLAVVLTAATVVDLVAGTARVHSTTVSTATSYSRQVTYHPGWIWWLVLAVVAAPLFSSQVTRLHDRGRSGWWVLFDLLPIAGFIVLLVQWVQPGDRAANAYGPPTGPPLVEPPYPVYQS
jgi:uncharacterized membrane protein YhaH (DUF805 family)